MHRASEIGELIVIADVIRMEHPRWRRIVCDAWRKKFGSRCSGCDRHMHFEEKYKYRDNYATIDHIRSRALGGTNDLDNITVCCRNCNAVKARGEQREILHKKKLSEEMSYESGN